MNSYYVVGGKRKEDYLWDGKRTKDHWHLFKSGVVLEVDSETHSVRTCVEYITPADACAVDDDPSILFKAASVHEGDLYLCTQTEVMVYALDSFERKSYVTLPCFNDVHHVVPTRDGTLLVANTGLDMVIEATENGEIIREWNVMGEQPWKRFSRDVDYRKIVTTKPHASHPNYVFQLNGQIWATRFEQKDAVCLTQSNRRIEVGVGKPHDGIVNGSSVYHTTVDGHIVVTNLGSLQREAVFNLNEMSDISGYNPTRPLGWCRGLKILGEHLVLVGFSRLRPTQWRENVQWVKRAIGMRAGTLPTRIALYDLKERKVCWEVNLEERGMDAVFSIHTSDENLRL
jgi:hypothetical protein